MELVLLGHLFGECRNLFFSLSLFLRKGHPAGQRARRGLVVSAEWNSSWGTSTRVFLICDNNTPNTFDNRRVDVAGPFGRAHEGF